MRMPLTPRTTLPTWLIAWSGPAPTVSGRHGRRHRGGAGASVRDRQRPLPSRHRPGAGRRYAAVRLLPARGVRAVGAVRPRPAAKSGLRTHLPRAPGGWTGAARTRCHRDLLHARGARQTVAAVLPVRLLQASRRAQGWSRHDRAPACPRALRLHLSTRGAVRAVVPGRARAALARAGRLRGRRFHRRRAPRPAPGIARRTRVERGVSRDPCRLRGRISAWDMGLSDTPPTRRAVGSFDAMTRGTRPVRVVAVTQSDPFFTARFFEAFLGETASDRLELVEIVLLRHFKESKTALVRRLLKLYGPVDFTRLLGRYVTAAVSDRVGRPRSLERIVARHGVPLVRLSSINDASYLRTLTARDASLIE